MADDSVQVTCPQCSSKLNIKEELRAKKIACPKCQYKFRLNFHVSESGTSSVIQAHLETRENLDRPHGTPDEVCGIKLPSKESKTSHVSSTRPLGSNSSLSNSYSGSHSNSQIPVRVDWGKEHATQSREFQRNHSGLSRSQIYRLAKDRYTPLSQNDEILQSTGIFLCVMAVLTATLPLFNLKFVDFATAGSVPAILSIGTGVIGMLMIVMAQRKNPVMALGLGLGMLLMFVVAYVGIFDYFKDESPFRKKIAFGEENNELVEEIVDPKDNVEIVEGVEGRDSLQQEPPHNLNTGVVNVDIESLRKGKNPPQRFDGFRKLPSESQPISPDDVVIPEDFNPDDDRFESDDLLDQPLVGNPLIEETVKSPEQLEQQRQLAELERRKPGLLNRRLERMKTETFYNGKPSTQEFEDEFEVIAVAGKVTTAGTAYLTEQPIIGFDYVDRGDVLIKNLVPVVGTPQFASTIASADASNLRGLVCHFRRQELSGVQALYSLDADGSLAQGAWAGMPTPLGKAGYQITSGGPPIFGFLLFMKDDAIVGVGLVTRKEEQ